MVKKTDKNSMKKGKKTIDINNGLGKWEITRSIIGLFLVFMAIYMISAFTSFLYSGASDYSMIDNSNFAEFYEQLTKHNIRARNVCGAFGASMAFNFIDGYFGLASYIIPIYLIMLGVKFLGSFKIRAIRMFILLGLMMIWLSWTLSAIGQDITAIGDLFYHIGGKSGEYVINLMTAIIGEPGVYGILILMAILLLIYFSKKTIMIIQSFFRMERLGILKNKLSERFDNDDEDEDTDDDIIETQPDPTSFENPKTQEINFTEEEKKEKLDIVTDNSDNTDEDNEDAANELNSHNTIDLQPQPVNGTINFNTTIATTEAPVTPLSSNIGMQVDTVAPTTPASGDIKRGDINTPYDPKKDLEFYRYPALSLLNKGENNTPTIDMDEQNANKERIINVLHSFGVEISSIKATIGPTITLYEITPAEGMRISKIRNLEDDIALSLAAEGIRIIAPIPGKGTIGIEVPNKKKCIVSMESILNSRTYQESTMDLPCALGKTITNEVFMIDLAKAPHLLVAGATGMGKSVGLNAIVTSLLYKKHPSELKIVMVDPKKVEFSVYNPIENHFLAKLEEEEEPIITDVQKVVKTLNSLCQLMDTRYDLLKQAEVRNIKEYNAAFKARKLNPLQGHEYMPYYVVIIDEFGDLIMTAGKEIELPICRIAQLARAVGIHMIIATQRPTAQIITGTIKANFPARIAFRVAAMMDSRIILDRPGANQLIGRGDMLYLNGGDPTRVQCAFVDTPEVSNICKYISKQQGYAHAAYLPEPLADGENVGAGSNDADMKHLDPMFEECARLVVSTQQGSTSMLQRNFSIGYNRAGKLMDQLQKAGIVGAQINAKPREVLIQDMNTLERLLENLR